jgi:hypothetical protein
MDDIAEIIAARYFYRAVKTPQPFDLAAAFADLESCATSVRLPALRPPLADPLTPIYQQLEIMAEEIRVISDGQGF